MMWSDCRAAYVRRCPLPVLPLSEPRGRVALTTLDSIGLAPQSTGNSTLRSRSFDGNSTFAHAGGWLVLAWCNWINIVGIDSDAPSELVFTRIAEFSERTWNAFALPAYFIVKRRLVRLDTVEPIGS